MYLTYDEYLDMGGTIDDATFYDFEFEARSIIDWYTFNRLKKQQEYPEEVKRCVYKLISMIQQKQSAQTMGLGDASNEGSTVAVASQSNDGVSVSYNILSASEIVANSKSEMENVVRTYLNGVVNSLGRLLLYRGVYFDE
jgi:hypothetical protein